MDASLLLDLYRQMALCRRFEEAAGRAYQQGKIRGFLHLYVGQEAVAVGAISGAAPTDYIVSTYREHAHYLARTGDARGAMAELFGKAGGVVGGRGGSMHLFDASKRFLGGWAIVGGHIPIAAGVAFASKYRDEPDVTLCFFGDGTANMGAFHEGLALAGLWKLPVVFICENNMYAMGTPLYRTLSVEDVSVRAKGYPIEADCNRGAGRSKQQMDAICGEQCREVLRLERGADLGTDVARAHRQAEHLAVDVGDLAPRDVVHGRDQDG